MRPMIVAAIALLMASASASAQDTSLRLSVNGEVRISSGGEFAEAREGQAVYPGQQLLIGPDSSATVSYPDDCKMRYLLAGQFPILPECDLDRSDDRTQQQASTDALSTTAVVAGTVVGVAAIIDESLDDDGEVPPLSP